MKLTWEAAMFFLGAFSALGAVMIFVTRAVVRDEMSKGNGYRKAGDCSALMRSIEARTSQLEYEVTDRNGLVRSRFHELANKMHVKLAKRELAKAESGD
jgi:hypothetical protein